ncbi:unnamed protein product [Symbiodinium sp. CCMP2592]|nr:unnamed protein product [Symbiodinium sp. CCMP2592]
MRFAHPDSELSTDFIIHEAFAVVDAIMDSLSYVVVDKVPAPRVFEMAVTWMRYKVLDRRVTVSEPIELDDSSGEEQEATFAMVCADRAFVHPSAEPAEPFQIYCLSICGSCGILTYVLRSEAKAKEKAKKVMKPRTKMKPRARVKPTAAPKKIKPTQSPKKAATPAAVDPTEVEAAANPRDAGDEAAVPMAGDRKSFAGRYVPGGPPHSWRFEAAIEAFDMHLHVAEELRNKGLATGSNAQRAFMSYLSAEGFLDLTAKDDIDMAAHELAVAYATQKACLSRG